jgi:hypothetical protein
VKRSEDTQAVIDEIKDRLKHVRGLFTKLKSMVREGKIKDPSLVEGKLSTIRNTLHGLGEFIIKRERRAERRKK